MRGLRVALAALALTIGTIALDARPAAALPCGIQAGHHCATLTVTLFGNGTGTYQTMTDITFASPNNFINCQRGGGITTGSCAHSYDVGPPPANVTAYVKMTGAPGSGICQASINRCDIHDPYYFFFTFSTNDNEIDNGFKLTKPVTVSVTKSGTGTGSVTSTPRGISCGKSCSDEFGSGLQLVLTAGANSGSVFGAWGSGPCLGQGATCIFTPDATVGVPVTFAAATPTRTPAPTHTPAPAHTPTSVPGTTPAAPTPPAQPSASPSSSAGTVGASVGIGSLTPASSGAGVPAATTGQGSDLTPIAIAIVVAAIIVGGALALGLRRRKPTG